MPRATVFALAVFVAFGAGSGAPLAASGIKPALTSTAAERVRPELRQPYRFSEYKLPPLDSGPGVIVFQPVSPPGLDPVLQDLLNGCSAWLDLVVGGRPEFGKTPSWTPPTEKLLVSGWR